MPLPGNGTISLQGHSRPGDALHSKPKQAMIVRMSVETLEAIQSSPQPQMQFTFGKQPGIHIGNLFYSMRPHKEASPHEIYLRTASAAKPNVPLKYYADVTGKFIIQRQLGEDVQDRVRDRTQVAEKQRQERKTILLNDPPVDVKTGSVKKRKDTTTVRKNAPVPRRTLAPPTSSLTSRLGSPLALQPGSTETAQPLRNRLIHCLAVSPKTTDFLTRMVYGASTDTNAHKEFLDLLNEIAEQPPSPKKKTGDNQSSEMWRLKTRTWTEVRPYEWPKLSEPERTNMARQARMAFGNLKIPESDPLWEHVRYRTTVHAPPVTSSASSSQPDSQAAVVKAVEPKKPAMPKEKTKAPSRKKQEHPVTAKDEGSRAHSGSGISAKDESQRPAAPQKLESSSTLLPQKPVRRLPGSGFKAKGSSLTPPTGSPSTTALQKKHDPADVREPKREISTSSGLSRPAQSMSTPPVKASPITNGAAKRARDSANYDITQDPGPLAPLKRRKLGKPEEGELIESDAVPSGNVKRHRKLEDDPSVSAKKKQLVKEEEGQLIETPVRKKQKLEDGSALPLKDHLVPPKKVATRDPSPLSRPGGKDPAQQSSKMARPSDKTGSVSKSSSKHNGTNKFRRGSEIYTSTEDERDSKPAKSRQVTQAKPKPSATSPVVAKKREHRQRPRGPLPKDVDGLRSRYKSTYLPYIRTYQQVVVEKAKLENALNGNFTDSDDDGDLMDAESLTKLTEEHKLYKDELESIQAAYVRAGGKGLLRPEVSTSSPSD